MAASSPNARLRARIELLIRIAAPALDLMLAAGDRLCRVLERDDPAYAPARMQHAGPSAPRGLSGYPAVPSDARRSA